jgi:hypothetical protein
MTWDGLDFQRQRLGSKRDSEVVELRIVGALYTYFGWFPWSDFEGESFSEEMVSELTCGRAVTVDAEAEEVEWLEEPRRR